MTVLFIVSLSSSLGFWIDYYTFIDHRDWLLWMTRKLFLEFKLVSALISWQVIFGLGFVLKLDKCLQISIEKSQLKVGVFDGKMIKRFLQTIFWGDFFILEIDPVDVARWLTLVSKNLVNFKIIELKCSMRSSSINQIKTEHLEPWHKLMTNVYVMTYYTET